MLTRRRNYMGIKISNFPCILDIELCAKKHVYYRTRHYYFFLIGLEKYFPLTALQKTMRYDFPSVCMCVNSLTLNETVTKYNPICQS